VPVFRSACPHNCWDQCSFIVNAAGSTITAVKPDPAQKVTGSFICRKGKRHLERINHPARLKHPLLQTGRGFKRVTWDEALALMAEKLSGATARLGPLSILHYFDGGHGGVLKNIESRFFSALGGCTAHRGSLCWSAGLAAQRYDFGGVLSHGYDDLPHSRLILIWGRNPAATGQHLLPFIRQAKKNGARVVLIDPLKTATAALADEHMAINPATDGALALGMAHLLIREGLTDGLFISRHCSGFEPYRDLVERYPPREVSQITGVAQAAIEKLAREYGAVKPGAILLGYGLQRHTNGGNTIRAIDALAALTGNIGVPGGGVSYANFQVAPWIDQAYLEGADLSPCRRFYPKPGLAEALREMRDPPVECLYISRANPLTQAGNSRKLAEAFKAVPFKVVAELFMTDTAAAADLVLPSTYFLEEEDLYFNSMSHTYLSYGPKLAEPPGECRHEYRIMQDLAGIMKLRGFPALPGSELIGRIIRPLTVSHGISLDKLKEGPLALPGGEAVPWRRRVFGTPDGKYHFFSAQAAADGRDPLPVYREPSELADRELHARGYRYWFATPHPPDSIHSAHRMPERSPQPRAYLHPETAREHGFTAGSKVRIESKRGSIEATAQLEETVPRYAVVVYEGWWQCSGAAVNNLTPDRLTDMGEQAALYDCLCRIEKSGIGH
jgi:anaerobic selenocysteine-containing dehydrogenase